MRGRCRVVSKLKARHAKPFVAKPACLEQKQVVVLVWGLPVVKVAKQRQTRGPDFRALERSWLPTPGADRKLAYELQLKIGREFHQWQDEPRPRRRHRACTWEWRPNPCRLGVASEPSYSIISMILETTWSQLV